MKVGKKMQRAFSSFSTEFPLLSIAPGKAVICGPRRTVKSGIARRPRHGVEFRTDGAKFLPQIHLFGHIEDFERDRNESSVPICRNSAVVGRLTVRLVGNIS
jgi:hypothetical protein